MSLAPIALTADDIMGPNLLPAGDMHSATPIENPWAGVINGKISVLAGGQRAVADNGRVRESFFSPSVAVGDLNGDGLQDLVIADPKGFFWYFPNQGTATEPKFTHGEVMPVWLGEQPGTDLGGGADMVVPRIQLVDIDGDHKLDLVVGTFSGKLFYIFNKGSTTQPLFSTPTDISSLNTIYTHSDNLLWCNYLAPFLYDWAGNNTLDLIMGDGSYSANSIFLFKNKGSSSVPIFTEDKRVRIIPGMGREHLVPNLLDWNNDGKPDVITGERAGFINLFLNTTTDPANPTFDQGQHIKIAGQESFGDLLTVTPVALHGNPKVPDLILSTGKNEILLARNTGTPGAPVFTTKLQVLMGINPFPKILVSGDWSLGAGARPVYSKWVPFGPNFNGYSIGAPYGVPYEILAITNPEQQPDLVYPMNAKWKNVLRYYLFNPHNTYFLNSYYPKVEDKYQTHAIYYDAGSAPMVSGHQYQFHFWVKSSGIHDLDYKFHGRQGDPKPDTGDFVDVYLGNPVSMSNSWTEVQDNLSWDSRYDTVRNATTGFLLSFEFKGQGELYIADVSLKDTTH